MKAEKPIIIEDIEKEDSNNVKGDIDVEDEAQYVIQNNYFSIIYGERFLDLMSMVTDKNNRSKVMVFTPDHHFMSADCRHLSKGGAIYFANNIDWNKFL